MKNVVRIRQDLHLSNIDKVFWPDEGYTKGDVLHYYEAIAKTILPYLKDRPFVLHRHPDGIEKKGFFQKHIDVAHTPSWIQTASVRHTNKLVQYLLVQDLDTLLYVANLGCIELNPFHSRIAKLENPDYLIFDLDPENISFEHVIEAALAIKGILDRIFMKNYCKTSGGRGLHIYVPLGAQYDYQQAQNLGKMVALLAQTKLPKLISLTHSPAQRQRRVYVDYLRNATGQTVAAPYCLRPKPHAPVSTPLNWSEVIPGLNPLDFTIKTVPERIKKIGDIFKPILGSGIKLEKCLKALQKTGLL